MNINLHIERLVLDGMPFSQAQGAAVRAAIEAELGRLLSRGGLHAELHSGIALESVRAPALQLRADSTPKQVGQQIARSIYGGIGR
ncbi:MAG: hypothetical protein ICV60_15295 [Pyrinomonadaceae bacterium]|nr:hypothetical protein [Pyrinomonadaceae bacterium]